MYLRSVLQRKPRLLLTVAAAMILGIAAAEAGTNSGRQLTLSEQLTYGLSVATPSDEEFVAKVVALVHTGVLPRRLVNSTFLWARQTAAEQGGTAAIRPMILFRPALILRARRIGIKL